MESEPDPLMHARLPWLLPAALLLAGCSSLSATPPDGDLEGLGGLWRLDAAVSDTLPAHGVGVPGEPRGDRDVGGREGAPDGDADEGGVGRAGPRVMAMSPAELADRIPLLVVDAMRIDEDASGMTLYYDQRPDRDVRWGTQQRLDATVEAGWDRKGALEVNSDGRFMRVEERFRLADGGRRLLVDLTVRPDRGRERNLHREFVRAPLASEDAAVGPPTTAAGE